MSERSIYDSEYLRLLRRAERAEAAIQRVRAEVDGDQPIPNVGDDMGNTAAYCAGYVDALRRVRIALDDEQSPHGWYDHERTDDGT